MSSPRPPPRILVVGPGTQFLSGITYETLLLCNALSKRCPTAIIQIRKLLPKCLFPGNKRVGDHLTSFQLDQEVLRFDSLDYDSPSSLVRAFKFARAFRPDAVIIAWWTSSIAHLLIAMSIIFRRLLGAAIIIYVNEGADQIETQSPMLSLFSTLMASVLFSTADAVVVQTSDAMADVLRHRRVRRTAMIPIGTYEIPTYTRYEREYSKSVIGLKSSYVVLFFGLIRRYKGLTYLLDAFEKLPADIAQKLSLLIVGEVWEDEQTIVQKIKTHKYREHIFTHLEYVTDAEVGLYFSSADLLCCPYLRASASGVIKTAIFFDIPIIASMLPSFAEDLEGYGKAIFVEPANSDKLAEAIIDASRTSFPKGQKSKCVTFDDTATEFLRLVHSIMMERRRA